MHPLRFACTRLYTLNEGVQTNMVVDLNPIHHYVERIYPLGKEEHPFTEWLGGVIILSDQPYEYFSYYTSMIGMSLSINEWIEILTHHPRNKQSNQQVYACHINTTDIEVKATVRLL